MKTVIKENRMIIFYLSGLFVLMAAYAAIQPQGSGPDENMKYLVCQYIYEHKSLPVGTNPAVLSPRWGTSYAFTPYLAYVLCAFNMTIASFFSNSPDVLYLAARFQSAAAMTAAAFFVWKISRELFDKKSVQWLFTAACTLEPEILFTGTYINSDSLACMSVAMIIYAWIIGWKRRWDTKSCLVLALGIGICAQSYYDAFGYILTSLIFFFVSCVYFVRHPAAHPGAPQLLPSGQTSLFSGFRQSLITGNNPVRDRKGIFKKAGLISGCSFLLAGWWYIRNFLLYDGDFLGLKASAVCAQANALDKWKPSNLKTPINCGESLWSMITTRQWIEKTALSFFGLFEKYLKLPTFTYWIFLWLFILGLACYLIFRERAPFTREESYERRLLCSVFVLNIIITVGLSMYYSYTYDFQPQGRYLLPSLIPIVFFAVSGWNRLLELIKDNRRRELAFCSLYGWYGLAAIVPYMMLVKII